jgi:hypothetical protein
MPFKKVIAFVVRIENAIGMPVRLMRGGAQEG